MAIPTITVHLTQLAAEDGGFHKALVMVPVCVTLLQRWLDPNELIAKMSHEALELYRATARGQSVEERGKLETAIGHHKNNEFELGGHRYVVSACHSDRPAFIIMLHSEELGVVELLHFYCAQGLTTQKEDQQALLARVADFELALAVVQAARDLLHIERINTRAIAKKVAVRENNYECGSHAVVLPWSWLHD